MKQQIQDFIDEGFVTYTFFPGIAKQYDVYMDAIKRFKKQTKYMVFIDCDEFVMPCDSDENLSSLVDSLFDKYGKHTGGITVNWLMYGTSGHKSQPKGGVLEEYLERKPSSYSDNATIKTIANPRAILKIRHAHYPIFFAGYRNVNIDGKRIDGAYDFSALEHEPKVLRLNHYFTKSSEEFYKRRSRRVADSVDPKIRSHEALERTIKRLDTDTVQDEIGLKYAHKIKELENSLNKE